MWTVGSGWPARRRAFWICKRQPGLLLASRSAPVSSTLRALRSPSSVAGPGSTILVQATGKQAREALEAIVELVNNGFDEDVDGAEA